MDTSSVDTKVEVLKTIRKLNEKYPNTVINSYTVTFLNLILNEILNNENEYMHIEAIITYKEIVKRFYSNVDMNNLSDETEKHILLNIHKIFERSEDLLFSSENTKNSYDAKDLIVIICEYDRSFKLRALQVSIKLLSTYLSNPKEYYLKNANSILFFCFKDGMDQFMLEYIQTNRANIKNILINLIKKDSSSFEEAACCIDIMSCFIVKTDFVIFEKNEIVEIFNKIFSVWQKSDSSTESHIGKCMTYVISRHPDLDNTEFLTKFIESKLKNSIVERSSKEISDTYKYLNLLECYFDEQKLSIPVFNFLLTNLTNSFKSISDSDILEGYNTKLSNLVISVINSKTFKAISNNMECRNLLTNFFVEVISFHPQNSIKPSILTNMLSVIKCMLRETEYDSKTLLTEIIQSSNNMIKNDEYFQMFIKYKENPLQRVVYSDGSSEGNIVCSVLKFLFKIIKHLILNRKSIDQEFNALLFSFLISLDNMFDGINAEFNRSFFGLFGLCLYTAKQFSIRDPNDNTSLAAVQRLTSKMCQSLEYVINSIKIGKICTSFSEFTKHMDFWAILFNYLVLSNDEIITAVGYLKQFMDSLVHLTDDTLYDKILQTKLFAFNQKLYENFDKFQLNQFIYVIKEYGNTYLQSNKLAYNLHNFFLMRLYLKFDESMVQQNYDIITDICLESLQTKVNIGLCVVLLKRIFQYITNDYLRRKGTDTTAIINNLLSVRI